MSDHPIYRGWDVIGRAKRGLKSSFSASGRSKEARQAMALAEDIGSKIKDHELDSLEGQSRLAETMAENILEALAPNCEDVRALAIFDHLVSYTGDLLQYESLFDPPLELMDGRVPDRSEIWAVEDHLRRTEKILANFDEALSDLAELTRILVEPIVSQYPALLEAEQTDASDLSFGTPLLQNLNDVDGIVEAMVQTPFAPELEKFGTTDHLKARLQHNLIVASGGVPADPSTHPRVPRLPTKSKISDPGELIRTYLEGTPLKRLFDIEVPITIPDEIRFEHHHMVAGSGHGKTQTLQHLILHDLDAVAAGEASIVVIDSQSDLIRNIAGLSVFAPGGPLADRLCLIDPTDVEWPVALNLFDVGLERINQYSQLDRERLINGILELYDFVLGSLLDAGMTQKQTVIFRYLTRLLLHIPDATIHTFRKLLEDDGYLKYSKYIAQLGGSARAFFETEYNSREFTQTRKQVLRRLYGILENQSFERMFSHPRSKLDLFSEMNEGKVILINTAKDLLKENGTEIFGRFFIAMIAQAAQERAVIASEKRLPTYVYIDEANDYFDRNIGIILSQARKYRIGMVLAHQFLGQLDTKLHEAISANTAIKFAGGVSAKDARSLAGELRTDAGFIEGQDRLSFATFVKGATRHAVSISVVPGEMERLPRLSEEELDQQRQVMRDKYAVHYTQAMGTDGHGPQSDPGSMGPSEAEVETSGIDDEATDLEASEPSPADTGEPMKWE